jgi:hypothetical protein
VAYSTENDVPIGSVSFSPEEIVKYTECGKQWYDLVSTEENSAQPVNKTAGKIYLDLCMRDHVKDQHAYTSDSGVGHSDVSASPRVEDDDNPYITHIYPVSGPIAGGGRLRIYGKFLGLHKSDIIALTVCGKDVLESLSYIDSSEISVSVPNIESSINLTNSCFWKRNDLNVKNIYLEGDVRIATKSKGYSSNSVKYRFQLHDSMFKHDEEQVQSMEKLKAENLYLKTYIDKILAIVMDKNASLIQEFSLNK